MKLTELQAKIDRRAELKEALQAVEREFDALNDDIKEYGNDVVLAFISFACPTEILKFDVECMPRIPARPFAKAVGESIQIVRDEIKKIEDELKGIVEFED